MVWLRGMWRKGATVLVNNVLSGGSSISFFEKS